MVITGLVEFEKKVVVQSMLCICFTDRGAQIRHIEVLIPKEELQLKTLVNTETRRGQVRGVTQLLERDSQRGQGRCFIGVGHPHHLC